jgi:mannose-6-phosphate isomerase
VQHVIGIARLENPIRHYAWGSRTAIAKLRGEAAPSDQPQAELWMGAHPEAPSQVVWSGEMLPLPEVIRRDPEGVLGSRVAGRFRGELPFLFKVLAADEPLSLQAHPDARQAEEGFARENASGLAPGTPERSYRDPCHKPELLCALTPFDALKGFRSIAAAMDLLGRAGVTGLDPELRAFRSQPTRPGLRRFFQGLLTLARERRERVVAEAARRAGELRGADPAFEWMGVLHRHHPHDVGILAPLLLNLVHLEPGQALFLPAGELHCYLRGVGIEIMANSDNVLRGGLTTKHVDLPELLRVLTFVDGEARILLPRPAREGEELYETPAQEFALSVIRTRESRDHRSPPERNVEILICTEGSCRVSAAGGGGELQLARGSAALVPASVGCYRLAGCATLYKASVPPESSALPREGDT